MAGQHHLPPVQLAPNGSLLNEARFEVAQLIINHTYEEAIDIIAKFSAFKKAQLQKQVQVEQERRKTLEEEKLAFREKANASIREKEEIERQIKLLRLRVSLGLVPDSSMDTSSSGPKLSPMNMFSYNSGSNTCTEGISGGGAGSLGVTGQKQTRCSPQPQAPLSLPTTRVTTPVLMLDQRKPRATSSTPTLKTGDLRQCQTQVNASPRQAQAQLARVTNTDTNRRLALNAIGQGQATTNRANLAGLVGHGAGGLESRHLELRQHGNGNTGNTQTPSPNHDYSLMAVTLNGSHPLLNGHGSHSLNGHFNGHSAKHYTTSHGAHMSDNNAPQVYRQDLAPQDEP